MLYSYCNHTYSISILMISKKLVIQNYSIQKLYLVCSLTDIADILLNNHETEILRSEI